MTEFDEKLTKVHEIETPLELWMEGATFDDPRLIANPLVPKILIEEGVSATNVEKVNQVRRKLGVIESFTASVLFGCFSVGTAQIKLNDVDPETGATSGEPTLAAISKDGLIITGGLDKYQMTKEGRQMMIEQFPVLGESSSSKERSKNSREGE